MKDTGRQRGHITGSYTTIDKRKWRVSKESFSLKQGRFLEGRELRSMSQKQSSSPSDPLRNACPRPTLSAQKISASHPCLTLTQNSHLHIPGYIPAFMDPFIPHLQVKSVVGNYTKSDCIRTNRFLTCCVRHGRGFIVIVTLNYLA